MAFPQDLVVHERSPPRHRPLLSSPLRDNAAAGAAGRRRGAFVSRQRLRQVRPVQLRGGHDVHDCGGARRRARQLHDHGLARRKGAPPPRFFFFGGGVCFTYSWCVMLYFCQQSEKGRSNEGDLDFPEGYCSISALEQGKAYAPPHLRAPRVRDHPEDGFGSDLAGG